MTAPLTQRSLIHHLRDARGPLIMAHRGTAAGSVAENTPEAARAAMASGADLVEIDVIRSRDGEFFTFHDGEEKRLLGEDVDLLGLRAEEIEQRRLIQVDRADRPAQIPRLRELLDALPPEVPVNLDRSWPWWDTFLPWLEQVPRADQLLLKCPAQETRASEMLRHHERPYPFIPICRTLEEAEELATDPQLNTVGAELIASSTAHPALDRARLDQLRHAAAEAVPGRELLIMVNSEVLSSGVPLFAGYDDERAVLESPAAAWGPLFDLGVDIIQTDWPWLLHSYRSTGLEQRSTS